VDGTDVFGSAPLLVVVALGELFSHVPVVEAQIQR